MKQAVITKYRVRVLLLVSLLCLPIGLFFLSDRIGDTTELDELFYQRCGYKLPYYSVQHTWVDSNLFHTTRIYVVHLLPQQFADLKSHIDSSLPKEALKFPDWEPSGQKLSLSLDSTNLPVWWSPPNRNVFSITLSHDGKPGGGAYLLEYDPQAQLLYIATFV